MWCVVMKPSSLITHFATFLSPAQQAGLNNVLQPTLFIVSAISSNIVEPESGIIMLNSNVDNCEQFEQRNVA